MDNRSGRIISLFLKPGHGRSMQVANQVIAEDGQGFVGDINYGRRLRQVLLIEKETLDEFGLVPGQVRENVTVSGLALAKLPAGTTLQAGDVTLEVTGDCAPCQFLEGIQPGLQTKLAGRRGMLCRVVGGGTLRVGEAIRFEKPPMATD